MERRLTAISGSEPFTFGNGLVSDGTNEVVDVNEVNGWAVGVSKFAISEWIIRPSDGVNSGQIGKFTNNTDRISIVWFTDNAFYISIGSGSTNGQLKTTNTFSGSQYHNVPIHIAVRYDGAQAIGLDRADIWINGVIQSLSVVVTLPTITTSLSPDLFRIGSALNYTFFDNDKKTEIGLWENEILTQTNVDDIYNGGFGADLRTIGKRPKFYYKTNEEDGATTLVDTMSVADGTLNNYVTPPAYFRPWDIPPIDFGNTLRFDGINDYVSGVDLTLGAGVSFGVSFWIEIGVLSTFRMIFSTGTVNTNSIQFNQVSSIIVYSLDGSTRIFGLNDYWVGLKTHLLLSSDGVDLVLYQDGVLITGTGTFNGLASTSQIGGHRVNQFLADELNEIALCVDYAPNAQDARDLYNNGTGALATDILDNVERYYRCNEADGATTLVDTIGNQNGTLNNFTTPPAYFRPWDVPPIDFGNALLFNGVDTYASGVNIDFTGLTFGLSLWIETNANGLNHGIFSRSSGTPNSCFIRTNNAIRLFDSSGTTLNFSGFVLANQKTNLLFSYDGVNMRFYIDGVLKNTLASSGLDIIEYLGSRGTALIMNGKQNEIAICTNYAPTAQDAFDLYNGGNGALATDILSNVERYYRCNEADGATTLIDTIGNQNGTLNNFTTPPAYFDTW